MERLTAAARRAARELLEAKRVDLVIGWERGSVGYRARPSFAATPDEADRFVVDSTCSNNLAVYLPGIFQRKPAKKGAEVPLPRIGIVAKACDLRSVVALIKERQAPRENLAIVGVPCRGMIDEGKLAAAAGGEVTALSDEDGSSVTLALAGGAALTLEREPLVQECCRSCRFPSPEGADQLLEGQSREPANPAAALVAEIERLSSAERWARFSAEMSRCTRCYACRQACPTCYCRECFAEQTNPAWIGVGAERTDVSIFHLIRIYHQAGRCVECDACLRACPMGIDLRPWTQKMAADVRALFGFTPSFDLEAKPPLVTFTEEDPQSFITEPGKGH